MEKSNLIISIIIVLCIAAAVAAYGLTNNQGAIFSDLASMGSNSGNGGHGIGNNTTHNATNTAGSGSGSGSSSGSSSSTGSGSGSGSGSSPRGGGSSSGGGGSGGGSGSGTVHSSSEIRSIAMDHVQVSGCYAGTPSYSDGYWYVTIYNSTDDSAVDGLVINDRTGSVSRG